MTTSATANQSCWRSRGRWNPLNIVLMILGFVIFWPLGLAMLAWIIWGDELGRIFRDFKDQFHSVRDAMPFKSTGFRPSAFGRTGNIAFDEYREAELKRLDEERRRLEAMRAEFETFVQELRRVKDQEEFSRFMAEFERKVGDAPKQDGGDGEKAA